MTDSEKMFVIGNLDRNVLLENLNKKGAVSVVIPRSKARPLLKSLSFLKEIDEANSGAVQMPKKSRFFWNIARQLHMFIVCADAIDVQTLYALEKPKYKVRDADREERGEWRSATVITLYR